jgi:hypothetical protein
MKKSKVSLAWQTVFAFIPFVNLWAAYRIQKLRKFLLIFIPLNFALNFGVAIFIPSPYSIPIAAAILIPVEIYYMRKWSRQWNEKWI